MNTDELIDSLFTIAKLLVACFLALMLLGRLSALLFGATAGLFISGIVFYLLPMTDKKWNKTKNYFSVLVGIIAGVLLASYLWGVIPSGSNRLDNQSCMGRGCDQ